MPQEGEVKTWLETKYGDPIIFQGICTIGRAESNNIIVSKGAVSRHHAIIHEREHEYWIVDLGGQNGTHLNGERIVQAARLKSGDIIRIPLMDFVFRQETASAHNPAPVESKPASHKEPALEIASRQEPLSSSTEASTSSAITIPLPNPAKPTQQEELSLGLPPELPGRTNKSQKPRVYVGPVGTQGLPKALLTKPVRPEGVKLPETVAAEALRTTHLPKQSDDLLKVTTSLSPSIEKPSEVMLINAPDVVVPEPEKPKVPAVAETDSFLQPSVPPESASSTESIALPQKSKEPALSPALPRPPVLAKPDKPKDSSSIQPVSISLVSSKPGESKQVVKKNATPLRKDGRDSSKITPTADLSAQQPVLLPAAKRSMYIGLASIFLPFIGLLTAPIAIVLGHSALNKIKSSRGVFAGRQSAVLGLYFGYISLTLISGYSILIYFLFFSPNQSKGPVFSVNPPPLLVITPQSTTLLPATRETASTPGSTSQAVVNAPSTDTSVPPSRVTPDLQVSTPPSPVPQLPSPDPDVTKSSQPEAIPPSALPVTAPQIINNDSSSANASASLPPGTSSSTVDTGAAASTISTNAASSIPPAAAPVPAVYDAVALDHLKDGMLLQPMPEDTSSRAYMDAESFNNCARILARPPEAKYAESVGDFLDDVKKRNPDPARLQILSFMYEKYMAGIKRDF